MEFGFEEDDFSVYRPPNFSSRLEGSYHTDKTQWQPSISYKHNLKDIKNQFTPAEYYRYTLATSGKQIRIIQRLELRWKRRYSEFTNSAIKVQSIFRGYMERKRFSVVKETLLKDFIMRKSIKLAKENFVTKNFKESIDICEALEIQNLDSLMIRLKSYYNLRDYESCIKVANDLIGICKVYPTLF